MQRDAIRNAFNSSDVVTRKGDVVSFDQCKVGRFLRDGTRFEVVGTGLNNIWGFVIDRGGSFFIQEANDLGYPVVPFPLGASYPGIGGHKARPYSPKPRCDSPKPRRESTVSRCSGPRASDRIVSAFRNCGRAWSKAS